MGNLVEVILRSISLFIIILFIARIFDVGSLSRKSSFRLINYSVIALISSLISLNLTTLAHGFAALGVWVLFTLSVDYLCVKSKFVHDLVHGKETVLIKHGKVMEENLLKIRYTGEELLRELRTKNVFNLADVEFAVMETSGEVNVLLKSDKKPVNARDLGKAAAPRREPQTVILDGNVLDEPLSNMGLNRGWLKTQLETMGIALENVFIGQVDSSGDLYVDLFDDIIQTPVPKVKEMLYANLQSAHADFLKYSIESDNEKDKSLYSKDAYILEKTLKKLEPYLLR